MSLSQVLRNLSMDTLAQYQGLTYGTVTAFDKAAYTADVEFNKFRNIPSETGVQILNYPQAYDLPVQLLGGGGYFVRGLLEKGDIVAVAFAVSEINTKGDPTSDKAKFLSRDNAVILGALVDTLPDGADDGDLFVGSAVSNMVFTSSSIVFTVGTTTFTVSASGATVSVGGLTVNLFTHNHPTAATGPPSPPTPGT